MEKKLKNMKTFEEFKIFKSPKESKKEYYCWDCKHKFMAKESDKKGKKCPNCGRTNIELFTHKEPSYFGGERW